MREVLDLAELPDMQLVDGSVASQFWAEAQYVWTDGAGIVGAMFDIPVDEQAQFGERISVFLEDLENGCAATPAIELTERIENAAGDYVRRFVAECAEAEQIFVTRGFFFGGTNAVVAFVHVGDGPARERVAVADEALYRTMYAIMGG